MVKSISLYLQEIQEYIERLESHINMISFEEFEANDTIYDASLMMLQAIGETAKRIQKNFPEYNNIPITSMIGMRNFISHDYAWLLAEKIRYTIEHSIPLLKQQITEELQKIQ